MAKRVKMQMCEAFKQANPGVFDDIENGEDIILGPSCDENGNLTPENQERDNAILTEHYGAELVDDPEDEEEDEDEAAETADADGPGPRPTKPPTQ